LSLPCTSTTPDIEREKEIVRVRVPEVDEHLADQIARVVALDPPRWS